MVAINRLNVLILSLLLSLISTINCGFWDFLTWIPTPLQWNTVPPRPTQFPLPTHRIFSKEFVYVDQQGHYLLTTTKDMLKKIGTIRFYSPDPTKVVVFFLDSIDVPCDHRESYYFVRWYDGWNTEGNVIIPYTADHPDGYQKRFSDQLCPISRPFFSFKRRHVAHQNFAELSYRFNWEVDVAIRFHLYFKDNPEPCHALLMDSQDVSHTCPYFKSFTLQNFGKPMNCSLFLMKHHLHRFEASLKIKIFNVGDPEAKTSHEHDKAALTCANKKDHFYINGNIGEGLHRMKVIDFCNEDHPDLHRGFPISCWNVTFRLVSSGKYNNKVTISYLPPTYEEICRWKKEKNDPKAQVYHRLNCENMK